MKKIIFLTPGSAWPGFRLAGMEQLIITAQTAIEQLQRQVNDSKTGLVVLDERLCAYLPEELLPHLEHLHPGKITILPSPAEGETSIALEIIRQAIGYHVRIQG